MVNPYLNPNLAKCCVRFCEPVINVCPEGMQRNGTFRATLGTSDFCAAKTTGNGHLNTLGAEADSSGLSLAHCSAEGNTSFQGKGNALSHKLGICFRSFDLHNINLNLSTSHSLQVFAQLVNFCAAASDHHSGSAGMNRNLRTIGGSFDFRLRNAGLVKALFDQALNLQVFVQQVCVFQLVGVPFAIPVFYNTKSKPYRVYFLTHALIPPFPAKSQ